MRTETNRLELIRRMADALQTLSAEMLGSGTARWGAYEKAGIINFGPTPKPDQINANCGERIVHTLLDHAALDSEQARRVTQVTQVTHLSV
jgi:hypothetical protein